MVQLGPAAAADIKAEKPKSVAVVIPPGAGAFHTTQWIDRWMG